MALDLFKSGTGSRGQILTISSPSTAVGATVIQLANIQEVVNFEVGMTLVVSATDGGTPSSDTVVLTAVNRSSGVLRGTASANPLSANWAASGYMSVQGDVASGGSTSTSSYLKVSGLGAWLPKVAPAPGDSFWNVDRSADPTRLAGVRYNGASQSIEEALIDGSSLVAREGGQPDMCFMSFASYAALEKSLGAKVQYVDVKHEEADIAFAGIRVHAPYGPITVIPDRSCPANTAYLLQMDTWKLRSLGKAPHILTYGLEGLEGLRVGTADALEIRIGYYANLVCNAPGWNCVITLSA